MRLRSLNRRWWRSDRGSYALETAVIAPVFFLLLGVLVAAARIELADGTADSAARAAARTASLQRSPGDAQSEAQDAAEQSLADSGLSCSDISVTIDASGLNVPVGQAATVSAQVACTVPLADIGAPGLPGSKTLTASFTSTIDQYRARS